MKINLGKILLLFLIPLFLNANVTIKAPKSFFQGETVEFTVEASGGDIKIDEIKDIDGYIVQSAGTSTQTTIINDARSYKFIKTYVFNPKKDVTIPSIKAVIDGKNYITDKIKIKMKKVEKTKSQLYSFDLKVDKKDVYVGEAIKLDLSFKYRRDLDIVSLEFVKPQFDNFWVKELKVDNQAPTLDDYSYQKLSYLLFPQKEGKLNIGALKIGVVTADNRYRGGFFLSNPTVTTAVYSNEITIKAKPLPKGINIIGDFGIESSVNKSEVNEGDAVSYKVVINGRGNIDDIDEVKLEIPNTTIYENPAQKNYDIQNGKYGGVYTKTFSIVAQSDFTISPISLKYFDKQTKQIKTIQTKSYDIKVNAVKKVQPKLEVQEVQTSNLVTKEKVIEKVVPLSFKEKIIYFLIGFATAFVLLTIYNSIRSRNTKKEDTPLMTSVKKAKNKDQLLKLLIAYINIDKELDRMIFDLENINDTKIFKQRKKDILLYLESLDKKDIKLDLQL